MTQKLVLAPSVSLFCRAVAADSESTAVQYGHRLHDFSIFLNQKYNITIDSFLQKEQEFDVYKVLNEYHIYLKELLLAKGTIKTRLLTAKTFLEYNGTAISNTQFKLRVRAPKKRLVEMQALTKEMVRKIILAINQSPRLQTYVLMLAATGMRANEALSILTKHVNLEDDTVFIRGEFTKTKRDRTVFLTRECVRQLKLWKEYRERERRIVNRSHEVNYVTKRLEPNDLFFTTGRHDNVTDPAYLYHSLAEEFGKVLDRIGLSSRHDNKGNRHTITLHSFRRWVKSTISDLGYQDYSEWYLGHSHSTYYRRSDSERLELFKKLEPYLTHLDYSRLEARGADIESKLSQRDEEILILKEQMKALIASQTEISKKLYQAGILKKD